MRIENAGSVFEGAPGSELQSATFPVPCVTGSGRWLCTFRAASSKGKCTEQRTLLTWSDNEGRSWSDPTEPFKPVDIDGKPGIMRFAGLTALEGERLFAVVCWIDHSNPSFPYFNEATEGLLDTRIFTSISEDNRLTWAPLRLMDTSPFNVPTPLTGPVLKLANGELACQFELNKPYYDTAPWRHASVMKFSSDCGRTWPRHTIAAEDPDKRIFYWDQRPAVLADGRILDLFWTFDREDATYLNIHARESVDCGHSWSEIWDTSIPGQPAPAFHLEDGTLAMAHVDRTAAPVIKVRRSTDGGRSWPDEEALVVYHAAGRSQTEAKSSMQDAWSEMYKFSVGLPCTTQLAGGGALLVYYAGPETDVTSIHWTVVR